ncbi:hypothetical protein C9374_002432 [Naegleria lovaniensis]|uniref:ATP-grasp domain-containing protein n=1 Tax=Naegleria lovaniensis TaxID=51637 RepID=A0AA88GUR5_NAELO|nr:uncharacterized protein C9374_002432 [Naegleria lovaniensis]KAG2386688.1 hypothetical protein C9374_002432 [Naegleria lovaniensis]
MIPSNHHTFQDDHQNNNSFERLEETENRQQITSYVEECMVRINQLPVQDSRDIFALIHPRVKACILSWTILSFENTSERRENIYKLSFVCREWRQLLKDLVRYKYLDFNVHSTTILGNMFDGFKIVPLKAIRQRYIIIGNEENRRVGYFQSALASFGLPPAECVTWETLVSTGIVNPITHQINVVDNNEIAQVDWAALIDKIKRKYKRRTSQDLRTEDILVRVDSPGENFFVEKGLFSLGCQAMNNETLGTRISEYDINNTLVFDLGQVRYVKQWYLGFVNALNQIYSALKQQGIINFNATAEEIAITFDKRLCHQLLSKHGIPVPRAFYNITTYDELLTVTREHSMNRVFVKLAHGSSASGVIAYCYMEQQLMENSPPVLKELATTSAELIRDRNFPQFFKIYNSLRIRRYNRAEDIREVINFVCGEGVIVEEWLEKANYMGRGNFDLRIVVIGGKIMNFVVRTSKSPMTNLHLGNRRGECDEFLRLIEYKAPGSWERIKETCHKIHTLCLPNALCLGVDVMLSEDFQEHYILEVNGFGDLIPRVYYDNYDTYQNQVREALEKSLFVWN